MKGAIHNRHGERLDYAFAPGRGAMPAPAVVVIGHGVTSHKDRPWLLALSDALAAAGIASLRVSFAGNGDSGGRFADATLSKAVDDLGSVLDALAGWRVAYAGHSMGAAVGVLCASRDARIRWLVSLAGMMHVAEFCNRHFAKLVPGRDVMFDKPHCPLTAAFLADAQRIGSLRAPCAAVRVPWLLVHGTADELVPLQDSLDARDAAGGRPEVATLPGLDHRFRGGHAAMTAAVVPWLQRHLL